MTKVIFLFFSCSTLFRMIIFNDVHMAVPTELTIPFFPIIKVKDMLNHFYPFTVFSQQTRLLCSFLSQSSPFIYIIWFRCFFFPYIFPFLRNSHLFITCTCAKVFRDRSLELSKSTQRKTFCLLLVTWPSCHKK